MVIYIEFLLISNKSSEQGSRNKERLKDKLLRHKRNELGLTGTEKLDNTK